MMFKNLLVIIMTSVVCLLLFGCATADQDNLENSEVDHSAYEPIDINERVSDPMNQINIPSKEIDSIKPDLVLLDTLSKEIMDIDGDGLNEHIDVDYWGEEFNRNTSDYYAYVYAMTIKINHESTGHAFEIFSMDIPELKIVDLDKNDYYQEIAVVTFGEYLGGETYFFRYKNKSLLPLGSVSGILKPSTEDCPLIIINGDSTLFGPKRADVLHTFEYYVPYQISEYSHQIEEVERDYYNYCTIIQTKVLQDFDAFQNKDSRSKPVKLKQGQYIQLIATDGEEWIQFENENGEKGWILSENDGLDIYKYGAASSYLEGLYFYG